MDELTFKGVDDSFFSLFTFIFATSSIQSAKYPTSTFGTFITRTTELALSNISSFDTYDFILNKFILQALCSLCAHDSLEIHGTQVAWDDTTLSNSL